MVLDAGEVRAAVVAVVQILRYELLHALVIGHALYASLPERGQGCSAFYERAVVRPPGARAVDDLLRAGAAFRIFFLVLDFLGGPGAPARDHAAYPGDEIAKTARQVGYSVGKGAQELPDAPPRGVAHAGLMAAKSFPRALHPTGLIQVVNLGNLRRLLRANTTYYGHDVLLFSGEVANILPTRAQHRNILTTRGAWRLGLRE